MRITMNPVTSTMIEEAGLTDDGRLAVRFRSSPSAIYLYDGAGEKELREMLSAPSAGQWFVANVRPMLAESVHECDVEIVQDEKGG